MNEANSRALKHIKKLQTNLWIFALALVAVALVGHAIIAVRFLQRQTEQEALTSELEMTTQTLYGIGDPQSHVRELSTAESELETLQSIFLSRVSGPATVNRLIQLAERNDMRVTDVQTQPGLEEEVGEHTYRALVIEVRLEGTLSALRDFLSEMESDGVAASRLDRLSITDITRLNLESSLQFSVFVRDKPDQEEVSSQ